MACNRILSIGPLPRWVLDQFEPRWPVTSVSDASRDELLAALSPDIILIIARGSVMVDEEVLDKAPNLIAVARTGVGYDTVSIPAANARRLPVLYTPGAMTRAVGEQTASFILACAKKLNFWREALARGDWDARYREKNLDLEAATLGIIGYGRIGRQLRRLLRPFDLTVLADDPYIDHARFAEDDVRFVSLEELLTSASIITLHVPLTDETRGLINRRNISLIKPGSILINTARGSVIESLDLLMEELESGRLAAVALDVFPEEPPPADHPLFHDPRVFVTGHISARTPIAQKRILEATVEDSLAVLEGRLPRLDNVVNPEVLGRP